MKTLAFILLGFICFNLSYAQTIDVQHYEINLKVPNSYNRYIEGNTLVDIKFVEDNISAIELMLLALEVDSVKINSTLLNYSYNDTIIDIDLGTTYQTNDLIQLSIFYHGDGHTDDDGWGGYLSSWGYAFNLGVSMSADPHNYGRVWYPCVDNFVDKATYNYNITCQDARTAVCGGTLTSEVDNGDGTKTFSWNLDREIPTYLSSISVGNYEVYRDTFNGDLGQIPVAIYARPEEIADVPASFIHLEDIWNAYEERFGAYRWSRVGYVGVPFNGGAMEHAENIAYPNFAINGNLDYESLFAHELAHSWFGNLITCSTAGDMWINEGWASYCEAIFTESLYGTDAYKVYNRTRHTDNLQNLHFDENGFWALYGIPSDMTYSSHVYQKGADVAHSLRGYLGDTIFFDVMTDLLNNYQFSSLSSYEFRDFLTANTPYDLTAFFDSWVFDGGWMHFSVDSFTVSPNAGQFDVEVFIKQKLKGKTQFGVNNRIPIQFLSANFERIDTTITVSGENDSQTFTIPFNPYTVLCDMEEQISDATTDIYEVYNSTGNHVYSNSFFNNTVTQITDSVLFRVEHNWVAPDEIMPEIENLYIHPDRYWKIDGIFNTGTEITGKFYYNVLSNTHLDDNFVTTDVDSIVVLYRANSGQEWQIVPHTKDGSDYAGYMIVDNIQRGEYAFAIWDHHVGNTELIDEKEKFEIFPNPTNGNLKLICNSEIQNQSAEVYSLTGKKVYSTTLDKNKKASTTNKTVFDINLPKLEHGIYVFKIGQESKKFMIE